MKKTILKSISIVLFMSASLFSCSSDAVVENENNSSNSHLLKPPPPGLPGLYYRENIVIPYSVTSDAFAKNISKIIYGVDSSYNTIEIRLSSFNVGTYNLNNTNLFFYKKIGTNTSWKAHKGTITITSNSFGMLTGTYIMYYGAGDPTINSINGYFEMIPIYY